MLYFETVQSPLQRDKNDQKKETKLRLLLWDFSFIRLFGFRALRGSHFCLYFLILLLPFQTQAKPTTELPANFSASDFDIPLDKPALFKTKKTLFKWDVESHALRNQQLVKYILKEPEVLNKIPVVKKLVKVFGPEPIVNFMASHDQEKLYDEVLSYLTKQKGVHIEAQKDGLKNKLLSTRDRFNELEHELAKTAKLDNGFVPNKLITQAEIDEGLETVETWSDWKDRHKNPGNAKEFNKKMTSAAEYADEYIDLQKQRGKPISESKLKLLKNVKTIDQIIDKKPGFYEKATAGLEARAYTARKLKALPLPARVPFFAAMRPVASKLGVIGTVYSIGEWIYTGRDLGEEAVLLSMGTINEIGKEDLSEEGKLDSYNWILNQSFDDRLRWSCQIPNAAKIQLGAACIKDISCKSDRSLKIELESLKDLPHESRMKKASGNPSRTFKVDFFSGITSDVQIKEILKNDLSQGSSEATSWSLQKALNRTDKKNRLPEDPDLKFLVHIKGPLKTCCRNSKGSGEFKSCYENLREKDERFHVEATKNFSVSHKTTR